MMIDKGKSGREGFAELALNARQPSRKEALAAGREPIAMWPLLVWAFKREMVRFCCGSLFRPARVAQSSLAWAMAAAASGDRGGRDSDAEFPACCHLDALEVYGAVLTVIDDGLGKADWRERRQRFDLLIRHAELDDLDVGCPMPPTWNPHLPDAKVVPVRRSNGKIKHLFDERDHATACLVRIEGYAENDKEAIRIEARARYAQWCELMDLVIDSLGGQGTEALKRWRLEGIGVEREPWDEIAQHAA